MSLKLNNISLEYNQTKILSDISCSFLPGQVTTLIGKSGCGKSSLLRTACFLEKPSYGEILFEEKDLYPKITMVFQSLFLYPHLTVKQNLELAGKKVNPNLNSDIELFATRLNILKLLDRYPNQLSGGEKQRTALVRALVLKPQYLLLDEITSALDIENSAIILEFLEELKETDLCIVLATHSLRFCKRISDQVIYLEKGRIIETGNKGILENPESSELRRFINTIERFN